MAVRIAHKIIHLEGHCTVEEALPLLDALRKPGAHKVVLTKCQGLHTAILQVLADGAAGRPGTPRRPGPGRPRHAVPRSVPAVRRVSIRSGRLTTILTISNRKGGSGKSTTSVNLAAECGARGRRTLLVDLDTQGHAGLGFGIVPERDAPTAHHIFTSLDFDLQTAIRPTAFPGVSVAPADQLFDGTTAVDRSVSALQRCLRIPEITARFDLVIVDTPPSLDMILVNALAAADGVLVPMIPHALSAEGVRQLARLFFRIATTVNNDLKVVGLLPVMLNVHTNHHRETMQDIAREFGIEHVLTGIRTDIRLGGGVRRPQTHPGLCPIQPGQRRLRPVGRRTVRRLATDGCGARRIPRTFLGDDIGHDDHDCR